MKKIILLCFCFFSTNAFSMSDYELCKILDDSGDPSEMIKYIGEEYLEGKDAIPLPFAMAALSLAVAQANLEEIRGITSFMPACLKYLKEQKRSFLK